MATYIQGVTDYIPRLQPFRPDFNFYSNILQTKEAQYQAGYEKLSNIYGTLLNSEMLRDNNINRRTEFFNKIDNDIKKIAGLDLSKQQNVNAAKQVFQPLIDDKYIQKDIVFTKNWRGQQSRAEALKNCTDPKKCGDQWWEGGVRALNYQAEDFKNASQDESLTFGNPTYTPYVNTQQKAMQFAKDMGFDTKTVTFSPDGKFIVTTKNGPQIIPDLTKAFVNLIASDPKAIEMYKTQGYLDRKDFIAANTERFGSSEAAEMNYLTTALNEINATQQQVKKQAEKELNDAIIQKEVAKTSEEKVPLDEIADANYIKYLESLDTQEEVATNVSTFANETLTQTKDADKLDLATMRYRVDLAKANTLLYQDMGNYAYDYAMRTMQEEVEVNKYALAGYEHSLRSAEITQRAQYDAMLKQMDNDTKWNQKLKEKLLDYYIEWGELPEDLSLFGVEITGQKESDSANDYGLKGPDFNKKGQSVQAGPGGTSKVPASKISEAALLDKSSTYNQLVEEKMKFANNYLTAIIDDPLSTPAEIASAKAQKEKLFSKGTIVQDVSGETELIKGKAMDLGIAATGLGVTQLAIAGAASTAATVGAANAWNPVGWALLGAAGLTGLGMGLYNFLNNNNPTGDEIKTISQGGYLDDEGKIISIAGHIDATDPNSPYNLENMDAKLNSFISTEGDGLFRGTKFKLEAADLTSRIAEAKTMRDLGYKKSREDNLAIRRKMVGLYGNDSGSELLVDDKGHKRSKEEFVREYTKKYQNTIDSRFMNPAAKLVADVFMDDAEDVYDEATVRFDRIYDRGEVSGLGIGINSIDGGSANMQVGNRVFNFDPAKPGVVKRAIYDLYEKDLIPALANPVQKGALFIKKDASMITADDTPINDSGAQSIIADLFRSSFSTKWKKTNDNRPLFDVTRVGLASNDPKKVAVTFTLNQEILDKYKGDKALEGITREMLETGENKVSVIFDRNKTTSAFFAALEPTPVEYILNTAKRYDISGYEEFGGVANVAKLPDGSYSYTLDYKLYNPETNKFELMKDTYVGDFDPNEVVQKLNMELASRYAQNYGIVRNRLQE